MFYFAFINTRYTILHYKIYEYRVKMYHKFLFLNCCVFFFLRKIDWMSNNSMKMKQAGNEEYENE